MRKRIVDITSRNPEDDDSKLILKNWSDEPDEIEEDYVSQSHTEDITFIELAMINSYMHSVYRTKSKDIKVNAYGSTDNIGRVNYGGLFDATGSFKPP